MSTTKKTEKVEKVEEPVVEGPFLTVERTLYPDFQGYAVVQYDKVPPSIIENYERYVKTYGEGSEYDLQLKFWKSMPVPLTHGIKACFSRAHGSCSVFEAWKLSYVQDEHMAKVVQAMVDFVNYNNDNWVAMPHTFITTMMARDAEYTANYLRGCGWDIIEGGRGSYSNENSLLGILRVKPTHAAKVHMDNSDLKQSVKLVGGLDYLENVPNESLKFYIKDQIGRITMRKFKAHGANGHWGHCEPVHWLNQASLHRLVPIEVPADPLAIAA